MNSRALSSLYSESVKNIATTGSFPPFVEKKKFNFRTDEK